MHLASAQPLGFKPTEQHVEARLARVDYRDAEKHKAKSHNFRLRGSARKLHAC